MQNKHEIRRRIGLSNYPINWKDFSHRTLVAVIANLRLSTSTPSTFDLEANEAESLEILKYKQIRK